MTPDPEAAAFDRRRHRTDEFSSGRPVLDEWLRRYAGQGQRRDTTRTFVEADTSGRVLGYYTLVVAEQPRHSATEAVAGGTPRQFAIPVCVIARLAVDSRAQNRGLGTWLLMDALRRVLAAAAHVGIRAVVVDAIDAEAASFYARFGFQAAPGLPLRLMMSLQAIRQTQQD